jgi:hypothetical protein
LAGVSKLLLNVTQGRRERLPFPLKRLPFPLKRLPFPLKRLPFHRKSLPSPRKSLPFRYKRLHSHLEVGLGLVDALLELLFFALVSLVVVICDEVFELSFLGV